LNKMWLLFKYHLLVVM